MFKMHSNTMKTSKPLLIVILAFTALIIGEQFGSSEAKPQNQYPWGDKFNTHDPNGVLKTNSDPFDTPFFKNRDNRFGTSNNNDLFGGGGTNFETNTFSRSESSFNSDFERSRKTAQSMFWIVSGIIIFTVIAFIVGIVACICIPTCYLARYRGRRTAGQVYQHHPGGGGAVTVPLTGYPTQPSMPMGPGPYPGQQQIPGQYPYPNTYQPNQNFPGSNYPNSPYPAATNGGNQPGFIQQYAPQGPNDTKAPYPNTPYPPN